MAARRSISVIGRPSAAGGTGAGPAWPRLVGLTRPEAVLQEIASWLAPDGRHKFVLELSPEQGGPDPAGTARVRGEPDWRLLARRLDGGGAHPGLAERAAQALGAWRAARTELRRAELRVEARASELDLLQTLGRCSAEAQSPEELFRASAVVLQKHAGVELVLVAHGCGDGSVQAVAFLARPVTESDLERLARLACERRGGDCPDRVPLLRQRLDEYDEQHGRRQTVRDRDVVVLPVLRRGRPEACLVVVPSSPPGAAQRRLLYGAANQLSLHLDRILTVREAERGHFRATLDSMPQAVFLTDRQLNVLQANRSADMLRSTIGLPAEGGRLDAVGGLEVGSLAAEASDTAAANGEARTGDGRDWTVTVSRVQAGAGDPDALVVVLTDVTESRRLQQQLAQSDKLSGLGQMISGIAHELNNPLASVLGYAQLVQSMSADDKLSERLNILHEQAERCRRIVRNLLSFARKHEPEKKPTSLNQVVDSVVALMGYQLRVDDIEVVKDLDPSLPPLLGDGNQLQQALVNLLSNARQAIRGLGRPGTILIRTRLGESGGVVLEVRDDGPGVPESIRSRIFDPFFTTKEVGEGTGLGLSLVYGIVAAHGGEISIEGGEAEGATFRIELAVAPLPQRSAEPPTPLPDEPEVTPGKILVVDDEATVARLICEALAADGHEVRPVANGREALECIEQEAFDLIVSDLKMPVMGGRRLYEEIERTKPELSGKLLLTTGDTVSREPEKLARRARLQLIHKPFDLNHLRRTVKTRLVSRRRS